MNWLKKYQMSLNIHHRYFTYGKGSKASAGKEVPFAMNSSLQVGCCVRCRINGKIAMIICKSVLLYVCVFSSTTECTIKCLIVVKGDHKSPKTHK